MFKLSNTTILLASLIGAGCGAADTPDRPPEAKPAVAELSTHVETHPSQGTQRTIPGAEATVAISDDAVVARVDTNGLSPGHVYTLWFVAINRPSRCATEPCKAPDVLTRTDAVLADVRWAAGGIADEAGTLDLTANIPAGAWDSSWFGNGLTNPRGAEIHLVVNDHGPVIAGREKAMQSSYREGCTDDSLPAPFPATAKSDGKAGPNKCALVQDAIFVQAR
jgi:hypothetical protein